MKFEDMINTIQLGDCYELIKNIPDKSIDLVIIDPPYQFCAGGNGSSEIAQRKYNQKKEMYSLDTDITKRKVGTGYSSGGGCFGTKKRNYHNQINLTDVNMTPQRKEYEDYVAKYGKDEESERLRVIANAIDNKENTYFISKGFSNDILDELVRVMKKVNIYIWCSKMQILDLMTYFVKEKDCIFEIFTWHKTNPTPTHNNCYPPDTEYCLLFREKGTGMGGTMETLKKWYVSPANVKDKDLFKHPTIKPLEVVKNHILNSTKENDIVLDCFCGSGTTCVAAKELNRKYIGIELNPEYHKIAVNRLNGITADGQLSIFTDISLLEKENK